MNKGMCTLRMVRSACLCVLSLMLMTSFAQAAVIKVGAILAETGPAAFLGGPLMRNRLILATGLIIVAGAVSIVAGW